MKFKFLPHTADIKFQAYGKTINEVFENSTLAISNFLAKEKRVKTIKTKTIKVTGHDKESLFYNFLEELIYILEVKNFIISKAKITIKENTLKAKLSGDKASNYDLDQIKSPTYHQMYIKKTKKGWEAQAVMDV